MSRIVRWLPFALACVGVWIVSSMSRPPVPEFLRFAHADKVMHFVGYTVLGGLAMLGAAPWRRHRALLGAWLLVAMWGACDEWHQSFVPERDASLGDLAADLGGAALGVGLVLWWIARQRQRRAASNATEPAASAPSR
jgi:VanZ family protein